MTSLQDKILVRLKKDQLTGYSINIAMELKD